MKFVTSSDTKPAAAGAEVRAPPPDGESLGDLMVVGIGASAGGLDACRKLLAKLPAPNGLAFILVQHLDPTHESMMVDLLSASTAMTVLQASEGMPIEADHLYVIPPGAYLSLSNGVLHLSQPLARHGARMPFDFLLHSLAEDCGDRAIVVVLSGSGTDGALGLQAVKARRGLVIAQEPEEAGFDGMPRSAIATGAVDLVLPIAKIPSSLAKYARRIALVGRRNEPLKDKDWLPEIIDRIRAKTPHDFRLYKAGTLRRRIERRVAMSAAAPPDIDRYLALLATDPDEPGLLAKDLLINVTSFFRDRKVFDLLEEKIIPDLIRRQEGDQALRIWVAGCSTGEETYSIAMLFREAILAAKRNIKLQVFASDVDPDAIATARDGVYPQTIEADVSAERLARFFSKEENLYRISPELRAVVVFTVQDVLADPPFSRIDFVSCRNLLIYLRPEAQAKVISLFHFALREGGFLLLGNSETVGNHEGRFEITSKPEHLYRHIGRSRPGELSSLVTAAETVRPQIGPRPPRPPSRQVGLAELCRQLVLDTHAPAALLINQNYECLYSMGPIDHYLRVASGHPTHDLLAMATDGMRIKLRTAIQQAIQDKSPKVVAGGRTMREGMSISFSIEVRPVLNDGEALLLICFLDESRLEAPRRGTKLGRDPPEPHQSRVTDLERELDTTRLELKGAIRNLEIAGEEQKAVNEEALSVNEEYQSTNEELLTSKEELQSLNEELTALNSQLQETLERQRTTSNDLQNVLYSTDIATLFLDTDLKIRFFTPTMKSFFNVIPTDLGRPLADLNSLSTDGALAADARAVLQTHAAVEREIEAPGEKWFSRRIVPYRTPEHGVEGVVVTFTDITERKTVTKALEAAKQQAELANVAKSRFLAAASHDLRQPLQTLVLVQGLLVKTVKGDAAKKLVALFEPTLGAMTGMLNTLLDINQIDAGIVEPMIVSFPIKEMFDRLREEFSYHARAHGLTLRIPSSSCRIESDPALLEQMVRNLLSNAMKYTKRGKVLLGCRRRHGLLSIEVWDTGIGIPDRELHAIFDEFHQVDNPARERDRGLGLGLSIVRRLADLLGHQIRVTSWPGRGSVFSIDITLPSIGVSAEPVRIPIRPLADRPGAARHTGAILVIEDDPDVRGLLQMFLEGEGHRVASASDGPSAIKRLAAGAFRPDIIMADYNLPNGMNGIEVVRRLLETLRAPVPVVMLTGDISTETLRNIAGENYVQLAKPVRVGELSLTIERLLSPPKPTAPGDRAGAPTVYVVDDDRQVRAAIRLVLEDAGFAVEDFSTCEQFLATYQPGRDACLLIDAYLPGMSGLELLERLRDSASSLPAIMITGNSDVPIAVQAMKAGASDFIEKPIGRTELLGSVERALAHSRDAGEVSAANDAAASRLAALTVRQRQIMELVLAGHPSKNIAADLHISQRTVENHRAIIMRKTGTRSLPALARLAVAAAKRAPSAPVPMSSGIGASYAND